MKPRPAYLWLLALAAACGNAHETRFADEPAAGAPATPGGRPGNDGGSAGVDDAGGNAGLGGDAGAAGAADDDTECSSNDDCPASTECRTTSCEDGECTGVDEPYGTVVSGQELGDCLRTVCDGGGDTVVVADPSDAPDAQGACFTSSCSDAGSVSLPSPPRTTCESSFGAGLCDGAGACVECLADTDCTQGQVCGQHSCVTEGACSDETQNGSETDVDCGGSSCGPCDDGFECLVDQDCASDLCDPVFLQCLPLTCRDGAKDGDETDVDCGGVTCAGCYVGESCQQDSDCATNECDPDIALCTGNSCSDQRQDGTETDVDCGGFYCGQCIAGKKCHSHFDCLSGFCNHGESPARCQ
jgi:hypothetical protein